MFCGKCGAAVENGIKFCGSCGNAIPESQVSVLRNQPKASGKSGKNQLVGIAPIAIAVVLAAILIFTLFGGGSAESVASGYAKAIMSLDFKKASRYSAYNTDKIWKEMMKEFDITEEDWNKALLDVMEVKNINALYDKLQKDAKEQLYDNYGKNYKTKIKITDTTVYEKDEIEDEIEWIRESFERNTRLSFDKVIRGKIKGIVEFEVEMTISGPDGEDTSTETVECVKIGGRWWVLDETWQILYYAYYTLSYAI